MSENFLKVWLKRDSRDGPIRSITRTLNSPKTKNNFTFARTLVNVWHSLVDDSGISVEVVVKLAFVYNFGFLAVEGFHLDCNFNICFGVDGSVNCSEDPFLNVSNNSVVFTNFLYHLRNLFWLF